MSHLIDTNITSAYVRGHRKIGQKFMQFSGSLTMSTISQGELLAWCYRSKTSEKLRLAIRDTLSLFEFIPVDTEISDQFARVRAELLDRGHPIATFDLMIAATALVHDLTIVTRNVADFVVIPGLRLENWYDD